MNANIISKKQESESQTKYYLIKINVYLFAVFFVLSPLDFLSIIPGVSLSRFLVIIPILATLLNLKNGRLKFDRYFILPTLYLLFVIFSLFYTYNIGSTIQRIIPIALNVSMILLVSMLSYNEKEISVIKQSFVYSAWITLLLMLIYSSIDPVEGRLLITVSGVYQDPNYICGFFIYAIAHYFDKLLSTKKISNVVPIFIFLYFIILTGSRGGLLAALGTIFVLLLLKIQRKKFEVSRLLKFAFFACFTLMILYLGMMLAPDSVISRFSLAYNLADDGSSRIRIWESIIYVLKDSSGLRITLGYGAGTIRFFTYGGSVAHNTWLESLLEIGVIGLLILFLFYFVYFIKSFTEKQYVITASFAGYLIMSLTLSLYSYRPIWNIIILMVLLARNYQHRDFIETKKTI